MMESYKPGGKGWKGKTAHMLGEPKVSKFDFTIRAHKYVSSFYISAKKSDMKLLLHFVLNME